MFKRSLITFITLLMTGLLAFALDDQGNPNDPTINDRANACYEGGSMEDRCETELDWQAGWFLIRYEFGLLTRGEVPTWVAWVLPPEIVPEAPGASPVVSVSNCLSDGHGTFVQFGGSNFIPANQPFYTDNACINPGGTWSPALVFSAGGSAAADLICINNGHGATYIGPSGDNIYFCRR